MWSEIDVKVREETGGKGKLPYRIMVERYRAKLEREKNPERREEYEVIIAIMLSALETQEKMDDIIEALHKLEK